MCYFGSCQNGVCICESGFTGKECDYQPSRLTIQDYDDLKDDICSFIRSENDMVERGHLVGGIVRLAAHDFMDFDIEFDNGGADGCILMEDFDDTEEVDEANVGLSDLWPKIRHLQPNKLSRADFIVLASEIASLCFAPSGVTRSHVYHKFKYGRKDIETCQYVRGRIPEANEGCFGQTGNFNFKTRMNMTWREAAALMGAHTLGGTKFDNTGFTIGGMGHGKWKT
eukprot:UN31033